MANPIELETCADAGLPWGRFACRSPGSLDGWTSTIKRGIYGLQTHVRAVMEERRGGGGESVGRAHAGLLLPEGAVVEVEARFGGRDCRLPVAGTAGTKAQVRPPTLW